METLHTTGPPCGAASRSSSYTVPTESTNALFTIAAGQLGHGLGFATTAIAAGSRKNQAC